MDLKLEVIVVPVSNVDRAKAFCEKLGSAWISTSPTTVASSGLLPS